MNWRKGSTMFISVFVLLVIVVGTVESGNIAGANYTGGPSIPGLNFNWLVKAPSSGNITSTTLGGSTGSMATTTTNPGGAQLSPDLLFPPLDLALSLPGWLLIAIVIVFLSTATFFIFRLKTSFLTYDLDSTIREMEEQQRRLTNSWSYRLRNRALLRYYTLLVRACSKIGLKEIPTETPMEFVVRASTFLKVDEKEAFLFGTAVNRCRYGEELSKQEANEASIFMGRFTGVIRGKTIAD